MYGKYKHFYLVVDGQQASDAEASPVARIMFKAREGKEILRCTGILVNPYRNAEKSDMILTAGHCGCKPKTATTGEITPLADALVAYLGLKDITRPTDEGVQKSDIAEIICHPKYISLPLSERRPALAKGITTEVPLIPSLDVPF